MCLISFSIITKHSRLSNSDNGREPRFRDRNCSTSGLEYQDENSLPEGEVFLSSTEHVSSCNV